MARPEYQDSSLFHPPVAYTADAPNGRPATDDEIRDVLLYRTGDLDDQEDQS